MGDKLRRKVKGNGQAGGRRRGGEGDEGHTDDAVVVRCCNRCAQHAKEEERTHRLREMTYKRQRPMP